MWSSRGVEGDWGWVKKGVRLVLRVQRGTEGYGVGMEQLRRKRYYMKAF